MVNDRVQNMGFWNSPGYVKLELKDGVYVFEINLPSDREDIKNRQIFAHEMTHLFHFLINQDLLTHEKERLQLNQQLVNSLLGKHNLEFLAIETGLPQSVLENIRNLGEILGVKVPEVDIRRTLIRLFENQLSVKCNHLTILRIVQTLVNLGYLDKSLLDQINIIKNKLVQREELIKDYHRRKKQMEESEADLFFEKEMELRESEELKHLRRILIDFFKAADQESVNMLYKELVLNGLAELDVIEQINESLNELDIEELKQRILKLFSDKVLSSKKIERVYYELRPVGYFSTQEESEEWLAEKDEHRKTQKIMDKISTYSDKTNILSIARIIIEEEIEESTSQHTILGVTLRSDLFWDFAPGSNLPQDQDYMTKFHQSVIEAINSGDFDQAIAPPSLAHQSGAIIERYDADLYRQSMDNSFDPASERVLTELGRKRFNSRFRDFRTKKNDLVSIITNLQQAIDDYWRKGFDPINAQKELMRSCEIENLRQQISTLSTRSNILMEPVAYAISSIVDNIDLDLGIPAHMGYGIAFSARDSNGNSMMIQWIQALASYLRQDLSNRLPKILLCRTIDEQRKIVGFEN